MANIKSAKKRINQTIKRSEINKKRRSQIRSGIKDLNNLLTLQKKEESKRKILNLESDLFKAVSRGVYKKNTASRIISRLSQKLKKISQ